MKSYIFVTLLGIVNIAYCSKNHKENSESPTNKTHSPTAQTTSSTSNSNHATIHNDNLDAALNLTN